MQTQEVLKKIIEGINPFDDFDLDTDLLGEGILDSLSLMLFIEQAEKQLNIFIPEERVSLDTFYSLNTILKLIKELKS